MSAPCAKLFDSGPAGVASTDRSLAHADHRDPVQVDPSVPARLAGDLVKVIQGYCFALEPTPAQDQAFRSHCGAARFTFNWGLARVKANLNQREAEKSYGITGDDLTPALSWSMRSLRTEWNQVKV